MGLNAITGHIATEYHSNNTSFVAMEITYDDGLVVLSTGSSPSSLIIPNHAYAVLSYNPVGVYQFTLFNPWNLSSIYDWNGRDVYGAVFNCTAAFIDENFNGYAVAEA
jgi:hypothetical protein